jgi:hypothetical protein
LAYLVVHQIFRFDLLPGRQLAPLAALPCLLLSLPNSSTWEIGGVFAVKQFSRLNRRSVTGTHLIEIIMKIRPSTLRTSFV